MAMDMRKIRKLIELINETGIAEIEIKEGEESVRISREITHGTPMYVTQPVATSPAQVLAKPSGSETTVEKGSTHATDTILSADKHTVKAPMVGTVYLAPSPGAKRFVEVGQTVKAGDTLCLIEAMKMFNQIEADKPGKISAVLIESGVPVEFGQPLFVIE